MDNYGYLTDDFLSNGFHQFYAEEFLGLEMDYNVLSDSNNNNLPDLNLNKEAINCPTAVQNLEVNIENFILDHSCSDSCSIWEAEHSILPEKTFLCNDSCNLFLNFDISKYQKKPLNRACTSTNQQASFVCMFEQCNKIYKKPAHLKAHMRRHLGDKPYQCKWPNCSWKFSRSDELSRHFRSHSGVKPYPCDYCQKSFSRSDHLSKHRKVHEKKIASNKMKAIWVSLPRGKPGRRPKNPKQ